jgi:hypothetical protein
MKTIRNGRDNGKEYDQQSLHGRGVAEARPSGGLVVYAFLHVQRNQPGHEAPKRIGAEHLGCSGSVNYGVPFILRISTAHISTSGV